MSSIPPQNPYQIGTVPNPFTTSPEEFMQGMQGFANAQGTPQQQGVPSVQMPQQNPVDMGHFSIPYGDSGPTPGPAGPPLTQAPQQSPFGYRDITDLVNARNAAAQAYATQSGQAPPALPQMVGPHVNPILGALLAAANFAANRENPRLIGPNAPGTAAAHSEMGVFQNQADLANQNAMGGYQSQIAARQAGLTQSQLQAQTAEQQLQDVMGMNTGALNRASQENIWQNYRNPLAVAQTRGDTARDVANIHATASEAVGQMKVDGTLNQQKLRNVFRVNAGDDRYAAAIDAGYDPATAKALSAATSTDIQKLAQANNLNDLAADRQATRPYRIMNLNTTNDKLAAQVNDIIAGTGQKEAQTNWIVQKTNFYPDEFKARIAELGASTTRLQALAQQAAAGGVQIQPARMMQMEATTLGRESQINNAAIKSLQGQNDATDTNSDTYQKLQILSARQDQVSQRLRQIGDAQKQGAFNTGQPPAVNAQGQVQQAPKPNLNSQRNTDTQFWIAKKNQMSVADRADYYRAYTAKYGSPPP